MKMSELKKYRRRVRQLALVEQQLRGYAVTDSVQGSKGAPSFELTTRQVDGYPHTERVCQLMEQRRWLKTYIQAAEDYIFSIEDERVCEALILYCMDESICSEARQRQGQESYRSNSLAHVCWEDVARSMGEPSGAAIKMAVYRYMQTAQ